eukprot:616996-Rhodomonas_salina.1
MAWIEPAVTKVGQTLVLKNTTCCKVWSPLLSCSWTGMSQLQLSPSACDSSPPPAPRKRRRSRADDSRSGSAGDSNTDSDHLFVLPQQIPVP